jgi:hypothetical protein
LVPTFFFIFNIKSFIFWSVSSLNFLFFSIISAKLIYLIILVFSLTSLLASSIIAFALSMLSLKLDISCSRFFIFMSFYACEIELDYLNASNAALVTYLSNYFLIFLASSISSFSCDSVSLNCFIVTNLSKAYNLETVSSNANMFFVFYSMLYIRFYIIEELPWTRLPHYFAATWPSLHSCSKTIDLLWYWTLPASGVRWTTDSLAFIDPAIPQAIGP